MKPALENDADTGVYRGRSVARRFVSSDGFTVLVGRSDRDNDLLTFKLAAAGDFWLHVAAASGSHVVVRNPGGVAQLPRDTQRLAAALAARYSKACAGGQVAVHLAQRRDVSKERGMAAGKVVLRRAKTIHAAPWSGDDELGAHGE